MMPDSDDFGADAPSNVIQFPDLRPSAKLNDAWSAELAARNKKNGTRHRFIGPLDAVDAIMQRRLLPAMSWPAQWPRLAERARLIAGQCMGVVGPQGGGKTSFAIQVAISCTGDGIPAIWVALELDEVEISERIIANMHGVHTMAVHDHWTREQITASLAVVHDMWKFVERDQDPEKTMSALSDAISLVKSIYRVPPIVVIDYLGKLASMSENLRQATVQAAERLRALAVREMCYVVMLAQPSRANNSVLTGKTEIESATDAIAVAGESAEIEGACAVMLGLNVFKADDAQELDAHVLISKARNTGREGREGFVFSKPGGVWRELDYLPATPMAVKADQELQKKDKQRTEKPQSAAEIRSQLNATSSSDAASVRRVAILDALHKAGSGGLGAMELRVIRGIGRGPTVQQALQELESGSVIRRGPSGRWVLIPR